MTYRLGTVLACALAIVPVSQAAAAAAQQPAAQPAPTAQGAPAQAAAAQPAPQKLTFNGDVAIWTVAIKPDKTADFEKVMQRLRDALMKSSDPDRQKQAAGWKVMKLDKPMPDGNIAYVHVISPVVPGADYTVMQTLYDAYPEERQALYDLYRGAFAQNLSLAAGTVVVDMSKAPQSATASVAPGQ